VVQTLSR